MNISQRSGINGFQWRSNRNNNNHTSLKMTSLVGYGYESPQLSFELIVQSQIDAIDQLLKERQIMTKLLKENLVMIHNKMNRNADKRRTKMEFEKGDWVFLKLQPYQQTSLAVRKSLKLDSKFYGLYEIIQKLGLVAYRLKVPTTAKIHPVFHFRNSRKRLEVIKFLP